MPLSPNDKLIAFEYALHKIAEEAINTYNIYSNEMEFNVYNNFTREKCLSFVYFLCLSNGHRRFMFEQLFDKFDLPVGGQMYGFVEKDIEKDFKLNGRYRYDKSNTYVSKINSITPFDSKTVRKYHKSPSGISNNLYNELTKNNYSVKSVIDYSINQMLKKKSVLIKASLEDIEFFSHMHPGFKKALRIEDFLNSNDAAKKDPIFMNLIEVEKKESREKTYSPFSEIEYV